MGAWFEVRYRSGGLRAGDDADRAAFFPLAAVHVPLAFPTDRQVIELIHQRATRQRPNS